MAKPNPTFKPVSSVDDLEVRRIYKSSKEWANGSWLQCESVERKAGFATMKRLTDGTEVRIRITWWLAQGALEAAPIGFVPDEHEVELSLVTREPSSKPKPVALTTTSATRLVTNLFR